MVAAGWGSVAWGGTISIHPIQDSSIYSENNNSNAKGGLFAGETARGALRRALLEFNIAGSGIPAGAIINSVTLGLTQTKNNHGQATTFELHPLSKAWSEGTSNGTGQGGFPTLGDATWNFRLYNSSAWTSHGGDFGSTSGTATIGTLETTYSFSSQAGMVADVQHWLNAPASNFGWLLRAASESPGFTTAREFGSRESSLAQQPVLTINFTPVPEPESRVLLGVAAITAAAYILGRRGVNTTVGKGLTG
jgi:hypothetical protein